MIMAQEDSAAISAIGAGESFRFACHPGLACFTECCRMLELELHPYDFVLLRRATGLDSSQLFERYIIQEEDDPRFPLPRHYLAMVDDGRASCPFVGEKGGHMAHELLHTQYEDRSMKLTAKKSSTP